jgi:hypothetical protein
MWQKQEALAKKLEKSSTPAAILDTQIYQQPKTTLNAVCKVRRRHK